MIFLPPVLPPPVLAVPAPVEQVAPAPPAAEEPKAPPVAPVVPAEVDVTMPEGDRIPVVPYLVEEQKGATWGTSVWHYSGGSTENVRYIIEHFTAADGTRGNYVYFHAYGTPHHIFYVYPDGKWVVEYEDPALYSTGGTWERRDGVVYYTYIGETTFTLPHMEHNK